MKNQISPKFKRAIESEVRRLMKQASHRPARSTEAEEWQKFKVGQRFMAGGKLYEVYNLSTGRQTVHAGRVGKDGKMLPPGAGNFMNFTFDRIDGLMKTGAVRLV